MDPYRGTDLILKKERTKKERRKKDEEKISADKRFIFPVSRVSVDGARGFRSGGQHERTGVCGGSDILAGAFRGNRRLHLLLQKSIPGTEYTEVTDGILIVSAAVTIYGACRVETNELVILTAVFLLVLSLYFHFLLNGKVFTEILRENKKGRETV